MSERDLQAPGGDQTVGSADVDPPADNSGLVPGESSPRSEQAAPPSPRPNQRRTRRPRTQFTPYQVAMMNSVFNYNPVPQQETRQSIAERLLLAPEKVTTWFQNRRSKAKREEKSRREQQTPSSFEYNGPAPPNVAVNKFGGRVSEMNCRLQQAMRCGAFPTTPPGFDGMGPLGGPQPYNTSSASQIPPPAGFNRENPSGEDWAKRLSSLVDISSLYSSSTAGQSSSSHVDHRITQRPPFDNANRPDVSMQQSVTSNDYNSRAGLRDISNQYGHQMPPRQSAFPYPSETPPHSYPNQWNGRGENDQQNHSLNMTRTDGPMPQWSEPADHRMMPDNGQVMLHNRQMMPGNPHVMPNQQEMMRSHHNNLFNNRQIMHTNQHMMPAAADSPQLMPTHTSPPRSHSHHNGYLDVPSTSSNSLSSFDPASNNGRFLSTDLIHEREPPMNFNSVIPGSPSAASSSSDYSLGDLSKTCITHPSLGQFMLNGHDQGRTAAHTNHDNPKDHSAASGDLLTAPASHDALDRGAFYANNEGMSRLNLTDMGMNQRAACSMDTAASTTPNSVYDQLPSTSQGYGTSLPTAMNPQFVRINSGTVTNDQCYSERIPTASTSDAMTNANGTRSTIPSTSMLNVMPHADSRSTGSGSGPTVSTPSSRPITDMNNSRASDGQLALPVVRNQDVDQTTDQTDQPAPLLPYTSFIDHDDVFGTQL